MERRAKLGGSLYPGYLIVTDSGQHYGQYRWRADDPYADETLRQFLEIGRGWSWGLPPIDKVPINRAIE